MKEQITGKAILIGLIISILVTLLSIKTGVINTANVINVGNIGLPVSAVDALKKLLGH